jgi:hypothetical protein
MSSPRFREDSPPTLFTSPARAAMTLRLLREALGDAVGDADEAEKLAWALLRQLAGALIRMPTLADVERLAASESIARRLRRDPSAPAVRHSADHHGLTVRDVPKLFRDRVGHCMQNERRRRSATAGLPCRTPHLNRWRRVVIT